MLKFLYFIFSLCCIAAGMVLKTLEKNVIAELKRFKFFFHMEECLKVLSINIILSSNPLNISSIINYNCSIEQYNVFTKTTIIIAQMIYEIHLDEKEDYAK